MLSEWVGGFSDKLFCMSRCETASCLQCAVPGMVGSEGIKSRPCFSREMYLMGLPKGKEEKQTILFYREKFIKINVCLQVLRKDTSHVCVRTGQLVKEAHCFLLNSKSYRMGLAFH